MHNSFVDLNSKPAYVGMLTPLRLTSVIFRGGFNPTKALHTAFALRDLNVHSCPQIQTLLSFIRNNSNALKSRTIIRALAYDMIYNPKLPLEYFPIIQAFNLVHSNCPISSNGMVAPQYPQQNAQNNNQSQQAANNNAKPKQPTLNEDLESQKKLLAQEEDKPKDQQNAESITVLKKKIKDIEEKKKQHARSGRYGSESKPITHLLNNAKAKQQQQQQQQQANNQNNANSAGKKKVPARYSM